MGRPPTSNFGGTVPPVPQGLRPWTRDDECLFCVDSFCFYVIYTVNIVTLSAIVIAIVGLPCRRDAVQTF